MKKLILFLLPLAVACSTSEVPEVAYSSLTEDEKRAPENAIYGMIPAPGTEITLFASEPMLINPTNIQVDEKGRVWVCEALNYRSSYNPENPVREDGDRILILEDTDEDGKADKKTVFYQGTDINAALGIWVSGNRAIVSCSPNVFILTDTDGDDVADKKEVLFTGLSGEQSDHAVHAFVEGPDGKLYFNFGNNGGQLMDANGAPVVARGGNPAANNGNPYRQGMVFRCNPDGSDLEVLAHNFRNNYELAVDSYGSVWQSDNDDDGNRGCRINFILEYGNYGYVDERTGEGWRQPRVNLEEEIPRRHWHLNDPGVVPNLLQTGSGSPSGITVYEGTALPEPFQNEMIHAEPGHNVVRAYPVIKDQSGYTAEIISLVQGKDKWFRPVDVATAPDGSVFIADWYDPAVGGHKFGDPERGRIYRVTAVGQGGTYELPDIDFSNAESAAAALKNPNLAVRSQARAALLAAGTEAEDALIVLWNSGEIRLQARALWLLASLPGTGISHVEKALKSKQSDLRITALRALRQLENVSLLPYLSRLASDPSPQVRREVAIALRWMEGPEADEVWTNLARQHDGYDRWYLEALGIGADLHADERFSAWKTKVGENWNTQSGREIIWRSRAEASLPFLRQMILDPKVVPFSMRQYFRAAGFIDSPQTDSLLAGLLEVDHPLSDSIRRYTLLQIKPEYLKENVPVLETLETYLASIAGTSEYLHLIRRYQLTNQNETLLKMIQETPEDNLRQEAMTLLAENDGIPIILKTLKTTDDKAGMLSAMRSVKDPEVFPIYLSYVTDESTDIRIRREALNTLANTWDGQIYLMERIDKVPDQMRSQALLSLAGAWNTDVRQKARAALEEIQAEKGVKLPPLAVLENKSGNLSSGKKMYAQYCATCHVADGQGVEFGPALSEIGSKLGKKGLYEAILYPSSGISFGYEGFTVHMISGEVYQGIIESRTDEEIVIRQMGGTTQPLKTSEIDRIEELTESLMPEGLHRAMSEQELIDLVEYMTSLKSARS